MVKCFELKQFFIYLIEEASLIISQKCEIILHIESKSNILNICDINNRIKSLNDNEMNIKRFKIVYLIDENIVFNE